MVGLTADGPTVGSNAGKLTLKAIVKVLPTAACSDTPRTDQTGDQTSSTKRERVDEWAKT